MRLPRQETVTDWIKACLLWMALGFSLGWYYTFTYYGGRGWPLPHPESLGALLLYYFSVLNASTVAQAFHWMLVFPLAGVLWVAILTVTAKRFDGRRAHFSTTLLRFGAAALPLSIAGFWLAHQAGVTPNGWRLARMMDVALRRGSVAPGPWLNYIYLGLGLAALAIQVRLYLTAFATKGVKAVTHYLAGLILFVAVCAVLGLGLAFPLRMMFE